jgi:hypothetical protein
VHSATDARYLGASDHALRIIETAERLAATGGERYELLANRYGTLGYRGHVLTKTRRYSTTFGALRRARSEWRQAGGRPGHDPAEVRQAGTDADPAGDEAEIVIERNWRFVGVGFFDVDTAARALASAALAREHRYRGD